MAVRLDRKGGRQRQRRAIAAGGKALGKTGLAGLVLAHVAAAGHFGLGMVGRCLVCLRLAGMSLMLAASGMSRSGLSECDEKHQQRGHQQAHGRTRKGEGRTKPGHSTPRAQWQCRASAWEESMLRLHGHLMALPPAGRSSRFFGGRRPAEMAGRKGYSAGASAAAPTVPVARAGAWKRFSRIALPSTKTLDSAIAPAASIGDSSVPLSG